MVIIIVKLTITKSNIKLTKLLLGDGTAETYTFSGFPHTIPGLMPGTPYYFTNRGVCNDGSVSDWNDNGNDGPDLWYTNMEAGEFSAENILSHNSSQEITHEPSQICESTEGSL